MRRLGAYSSTRLLPVDLAGKRAGLAISALRQARGIRETEREAAKAADFEELVAREGGRTFDRELFLSEWNGGVLGQRSAPLGNSQTSARTAKTPLPRFRSESPREWWGGVEAMQREDGWSVWALGSLSRWRRVARWSLRTLVDDELELRRTVKLLAAALRPIQRRERAAGCGDMMIGEVGVSGRRGGGWTFCGLSSCSSPWDCPACAYAIRATRASEVREAVRLAREAGGTPLLGTPTVRHSAGNDLREQRLEYQAALKLFRLRLRRDEVTRDLLSVGDITGREVTIGSKGWHYHCHLLFFARRTVTEDELELANSRAKVLWIDACRASGMAPERLPSYAHGFDLRRSTDDDYIAKLGLEVAAIGKRGRGESRSPWEVAFGAVDGVTEDVMLWREHSAAMQGVPSVRVSPLCGEWLRSLGWKATESEELAADETIGDLVLEIPIDVYRTLRSRTQQGDIWEALSLEAAGDMKRALRALVPKGWDVAPGEWGAGGQVLAEERGIYDALERRSIRAENGPEDRREIERANRERFRNAHDSILDDATEPFWARSSAARGFLEALEALDDKISALEPSRSFLVEPPRVEAPRVPIPSSTQRILPF